MAHNIFTPDQTEQFFRVRLDSYKLRHTKGMEHRSCCPFHGGNNPTQFWVDIAEGNWCCFTCGAKGATPYFFEQKLMISQRGQNASPSHDEVMRSIEEVLGTPFVKRVYPDLIDPAKKGGWDRTKARDYYRYTDEEGNELFTVWRFVDRNGRKMTPPDMPCDCGGNQDAVCERGCEGGRVWGIQGARRVLYRLPDVLQSMLVFVVEGEKNANDLSRALARYIKKHGGLPLNAHLVLDHVAVTTNPGGANGWKPEHKYGRYFYGKIVVKLSDNDAAGRMHEEAVCKDVAPYAHKLYTLALPVGEGEDISDYLQQHGVEAFVKLLPQVVQWQQPVRKQPTIDSLDQRMVLVKPSALIGSTETGEGDWLVPGLIERGMRGLVVAPPKTGKSLLFLDMVLALATQQRFLGIDPYHRPVKCAVISREDGPGMVYRRLKQLAVARHLSMHEVDKNILVNTREQSERFMIDQARDVEEMATWLKSAGVEFVVIDVLNRLHGQQENSSDEMTRVMQCFDRLAQLSGAQVCVIHHTNKAGGVKGSTSIEGWADFIIRLEQSPDDEAIKRLIVRTKSSASISPRSMRYWQSDDLKESRITIVREAA